MNRITIKHLEALCDHLNKVTGHTREAYRQTADGVKANIGTYYISQAYGGYCLHQMVNEGGGVRTPLIGGHVPARELYGLMQAFIYGIESEERTKS